MIRRNRAYDTYNLVHDPACDDAESPNSAPSTRRSTAPLSEYGWHDLLDPTGATPPSDPTHETFPLDRGFHETDQGTRYTISLLARTEIIGRLRQLNHQAYADEVFLGLHKHPKKHPDVPAPPGTPSAGRLRGKVVAPGAPSSRQPASRTTASPPPDNALF